MRTGLHVYRPFQPEPQPPSVAEGLDLARLRAYCMEAPEARPFAGTVSGRINSSEWFFQDAARTIRCGGLVVPNPFGIGTLTSTHVRVCPSTPWATVPLYVGCFAGPEPFYVFKRGLSWCTNLGMVFPDRGLFVSFQLDEQRLAHDVADIEQAFEWFHAHLGPTWDRDVHASATLAPCVLLTSPHFAHHLWNELSVVEGLIEEELHESLELVVNQQPIAPLTTLFPEIPPSHVHTIAGPPDEAMRAAMRRGLLVVPAGRRHVPASLVGRVLDVAQRTHPVAAARAAEFRARHPLVLWMTIRLDARTATNLVEALTAAITAVRRRFAAVGVVFDGFTRPAGVPQDWQHTVIAAEQEAVQSILAGTGSIDNVMLIGRETTEAFLWARVVDYYVCPYGSAQHKVAWFNPVPGLVHVGENKRPVAGGRSAIQAGPAGTAPAFFFAPVTRHDAVTDARTDLFSYYLDPDAFTSALMADLDARAGRHADKGIRSRQASGEDPQ